jgi:ferritin-like metal-binding protein YciE
MPAVPNERDTKLITWLNEAHAKEAELEADLTAHIALTQKLAKNTRLQKHLTETRSHKRQVASRIKKLGGEATSGVQLPGVPGALGEVAGKAVAAVKGQVGTARAAVTEQAETHLRNAQEELREEHVEIAIYSRIATFAEEVGDRETAQLAKAIRRDEERMAKFLDAELGRLVKDVIRAEIPRDQRGGTRRRRTRRATPSSRAGTTRRSTSSGSSRASSSSASRSSGSRASSSRSGSTRGGSTRSSARSSSTRSSTRSGSTRGGSTRSSARSTASRNGASASRSSGSTRRATAGSR